MCQDDESRLAMELELLEAMYPDQTTYSARSRDFKYNSHAALLHLRLPELYPEAGFPEVLAANDASKRDIRDKTKASVRALELGQGEESLDAIIACFQELVAAEEERNDLQNNPRIDDTSVAHAPQSPTSEPSKTVVVWLHHLLALSKRKLATSPPRHVCGITKPGYPGVMVFAGPRSAVNDHVNTLKAENWQAFQVRYEGDELWEFGHGAETVREVETMAEVVKMLEAGEHGARHKGEFLKAVGIK
ncbi:hypothetical protein B0J11DRAFT_433357 [Dendryphion nanum]|uniref:RWD domain-containing protein n=1 Tax=Dendryphion nanum TaxID=256645 RepID=A0A9P9DWB9_9PLEO|nr:hypothetical protein B0J11DRAFT_433357 [Dendryphion nanum]